MIAITEHFFVSGFKISVRFAATDFHTRHILEHPAKQSHIKQ